MASTARCLGPPRWASPASETTSSGPKTRMEETEASLTVMLFVVVSLSVSPPEQDSTETVLSAAKELLGAGFLNRVLQVRILPRAPVPIFPCIR